MASKFSKQYNAQENKQYVERMLNIASTNSTATINAPYKINYRNIIDTMLKRYGSMSIDLIKIFLQLSADKENHLTQTHSQDEVKVRAVVATITSLCTLRKCRLEGDVLITANRKEKNADMMDCLWVAQDMFRIQMQDKEFAYDDLFVAEEPCMLCRVVENGPISFLKVTETNLPMLLMLQNNYTLMDNRVKDKNIMLGGYVAVVTEEGVIESIRQLNLDLPLKIALLKSGETRHGMPLSIRYFE